MSAMASEPSLYLSSKNKLSKQKKENKVNHNDSAADFYKSLTAQDKTNSVSQGFSWDPMNMNSLRGCVGTRR
jgi:hypothetical protein